MSGESRHAALAATLRALSPHMRLVRHPDYGLTYHACRFCRANTGALWKYGVRHYICDACKADRS